MLFFSCCDSSEDKTTQATYTSSSYSHEEENSTTNQTMRSWSKPRRQALNQLPLATAGVFVDITDNGKPIIKEVAPAGVAAAWNKNNPDNQILPFDAILEVNGGSVQGVALPEQLELTGGKITLRLKRPMEITAVIKRPGALGLTVNYKKSSASPWVASIEEGLLANFNKILTVLLQLATACYQ
eukprot:gb/GFBE01012455.1/.p1 GENE.gb/GFBE01012455.1/~~gb/GFBE01012455.1/.p1  ORF type:complete len:184 (+),score=34.46 gb/GFBE01012455.1/:1-552(+)